MLSPDELYIMDVGEFTKDMFRMGNAKWPSFTEDRARVDVPIIREGGIEVVIANGNGFSAFDHITKAMTRPGRKVWRIRKGVALPQGIKLVKDIRRGYEGHYMLAPEKKMPLKKYLGILEELGLDRTKVDLLSRTELSNVG